MSKLLNKDSHMKKPGINGQFDTNKTVRLGTNKAPANISVQTEARKQELIEIFQANGWASIITVNESAEENIRDLEILEQRKEATSATTTKLASRNDPCPCGSGQKYKKCCAQ